MSLYRWLCSKLRRPRPSRSTVPRPIDWFRPRCEPLEDRELLAVFIVTQNTDAVNGTAGTLSSAISAANLDTVQDTVQFNIGGGGVQTILVTNNLPAVTNAIIIDGMTQPNPGGITSPLIELDFNGTNTAVVLAGNANNSVVRGLSIVNANGAGLSIQTNGNQVSSTYIGLRANGSTATANSGSGIAITGSNNTIGGTTTTTRNLVSGNGQNGISIDGTGGAGTSNTIQNTFIGLAVDGSTLRPNALDGIAITNNASNNLIGSITAGLGNVISGNTSDGVFLSGASNNTILGNIIGLDSTGTQSGKGNGADGLNLFNAGNNTIASNTISQNIGDGIEFLGASTNNHVRANFIGLSTNGQLALGNKEEGIDINGGGFNIIGGTGGSVTRNVISSNANNGVLIQAGNGNNQILGNYIGLDSTGASQRGNGLDGVRIQTPSNTIGGSASGAGNVISGNQGSGVNIKAGGTSTILQGNFVGTNAAGTAAVANLVDGVTVDTSNNATIGGTASAARNVISGNVQTGLNITGGSMFTQVQGNFIGTQGDGKTGLPNNQHGVLIQSAATQNTVGGTASGAGNVIAFNTLNGVTVGKTSADVTSKRNTISSNSIFSNGLLGIDLGNDFTTANDTQDPDAGANGKMNFPVLTTVTTAGSTTTVTGTLNSIASNIFQIELFGSDAADASGNGEGQTFLGSQLVQTDTQGNVSFSISTTQNVSGKFLTATATFLGTAAVTGQDPGDTSEFSKALQNGTVTTTTTPVSTTSLSITKNDSPDPVQGGATLTYSLTVSSTGGTNTSVTVTDTLPTSATFVSATSSTGTVTRSGNVVTANVGSLASGNLATVTIVVTAPNTATTLSNTAQVVSAENPNPSAGAQTAAQSTTVTVPSSTGTPIIALAKDAGGSSTVQVLNATTRSQLYQISPYGAFAGGVRVAVGDVNGDGQDDLITGAGPGGGPHVRVFDGKTGAALASPVSSFFAYSPQFTGGVFVAAGDVTGDGKADIITGADAGGGPHVIVFDSSTGGPVGSFFAYDISFRGGVRVGAADVNGDSRADVITGPGSGMAPQVRVYNGATIAAPTVLSDGFVYDTRFTGGVYVAGLGDITGDGKEELVVGPSFGGVPVADIFSASLPALTFLRESLPIGNGATGTRVSGVRDSNSDGKADVLAAQGPGRNRDPVLLDSATLSTLDTLFTSLSGALFVSASRK